MDDDSRPADHEFPDLALHPGQMNICMHDDPAVMVSALCDTNVDGSKRWVGYAAALQEEQRKKIARNNRSSLPVDTRGNRLIPIWL